MAKNTIDEMMSMGIDIGKDTFHIVAFDPDGQLVLRKQIKRLALVATIEKLPRCVVGMEACLSAHFVSRTLRKMGFEPLIMPAIHSKPCGKGQKNDCNGAEAIAVAALRPNLPVFPGKSQKQPDLQALHHVRSRLASRRTATVKQIRAFLVEQVITVRNGVRTLQKSCETILEERRKERSPRSLSVLMVTGSGWMIGSIPSRRRSKKSVALKRTASKQ